ncbi:ORF6C domain-containing protein [Enterococcus sp. DIV1420a]|uniref:ORF6C domain-containing protein n=1 Tax=Enterococcus sp. DIV1420a TaxID=2774672 RepID=UPI003F286A71
MNELIKVTTNENGQQVTSGRELHEFLEVKTPYTQWFEDMCRYGFSESVDFIKLNELSEKNEGSRVVKRSIINHALTLDMAKELSMIQRTDKGKQARQYFIEVEKQAKALPMSNTELLLETALKHERAIGVVNERLDKLETETALNASQRRKIQGMVQSTVIKVLGGKKANAYKNSSINKSAFSNCYSQLKRVFDVSSYVDIPKVHFEEALHLIPKWQPDLELQSKIDTVNGQRDLFDDLEVYK